jgi:NAD+ synthetase
LSSPLRIALIQANPLVGDLMGNREAITDQCRRAAAAGCRLALAPELALWGYPPRDLLLRPALQHEHDRQLQRLAADLPTGLQLLLGVSDATAIGCHNAIALVGGGGWRIVAHKRLLPCHDVFDERRYFQPGTGPCWLDLPTDAATGRGSVRLGLTICEDLWVVPGAAGGRGGAVDPIGDLLPFGVDLLINLSASPYGRDKPRQRRQQAAAAARRLGTPVLYVNQVGGNDELIFDGGSFVLNADGSPALELSRATEELGIWSAGEASGVPPHVADAHDLQQELWQVLVLGLRDYARKCGFRSALLGLSGGIDSALVACLAVAALGAGRVRALLLPSPHSSRGSVVDAEALARRLGIRTDTVPIAGLMEGCEASLTPVLGGPPRDVTAENLQSRLRGTLLMAVANQEGHLLLATGNKSELAVGYCTLYGDMNGGLAVIGDLFKTEVYVLARWLDSDAARMDRERCGLAATGPLIGREILDKPPSAELRPDQKDSDSLPDYDILDALLRRFVENHATPEELLAEGADPALVERVWMLLRRAEFKRRQAPPVLKSTGQAFGSGWRMPIAAGG